MKCHPSIFSLLLFAFALLTGCTVQNQSKKIDATFFGGSEPVGFKLRLGKQDVLHALDLIDEGADTESLCAPVGAAVACEDHFDNEDCGDFTSWQSNRPLVTAALNLLAEAPFRKMLRNALRDSTFELVEMLEGNSRHKIAQAPIGTVFEPIHYVRPALEKKRYLAALVFHENAHVAGLADEDLRGGQLTHDVLSSAGLCLQKIARRDHQESGGSTGSGGTTGTSGTTGGGGGGATGPNRNYTGRYDFKLGNVNHILILDQDSQGVLTGELSGVPNIVASGTLSGQVSYLNSTQDQIEFTWGDPAHYFNEFSGTLNAASGSGEARQTQGVGATDSWTLAPATALFSDTFVSSSVSLAGRNPWSVLFGAFSLGGGQVGGSSSANLATVSGLGRSSGVISAIVAVAPTMNDPTDVVGLAAQVKTSGDHYRIHVFRHDSSRLKVEFFKSVDGNISKFGSATFNSTDTRGELSFGISPGFQRAYWNGVLVHEKNDSSIVNAGLFGMFASDTAASVNGGRLNAVRIAP